MILLISELVILIQPVVAADHLASVAAVAEFIISKNLVVAIAVVDGSELAGLVVAQGNTFAVVYLLADLAREVPFVGEAELVDTGAVLVGDQGDQVMFVV